MIEKILHKIVRRFNEIPEHVFMMHNPSFSHEGVELKYSQSTVAPENNFTSRLQCILLSEEDLKSYGFHVDVEIGKNIRDRFGNFENLQKSYRELLMPQGTIRPDLIIHKGQNLNNPKEQLLALECKISNNLSFDLFAKDLLKLCIYREIFAFQECIYLVVNMEHEKINTFIRTYKEKYFLADDGIVILCSEGFGKEPELLSLY